MDISCIALLSGDQKMDKVVCKDLLAKLVDITQEISSTKVRYGLKSNVHRSWCLRLEALVQEFEVTLEGK